MYNVDMKKLIIKIIKAYQKHYPYHGRCRYNPTCSQYAIEAYQKFNFFYATFLALKRILKCNPLFKGGYDPVPLARKEKLEKRK